MAIAPFSIARLPRLLFGSGQIERLPELARQFGTRALLITGARSFRQTPRCEHLLAGLGAHGMDIEELTVRGEPSPQLVDEAVAQFGPKGIQVVVAIGGGSVLDAAKAIAGLLPHGNSVMDHLEGVGGNLPYRGPATPFIAVPSTAGTGSEATKNAVLSVQGENGFKKSFRHDALVPEYAVVDPELLANCPPELMAADGMDAFTQLLESYVSLRANPLTDALARSGMAAVRDGFFAACQGGTSQAAMDGRAAMAYASHLSGITLAQTGLGSVHGLAAPLGAFFPIPHGVACGTLVAKATEVNVAALLERDPGNRAVEKYADVAALLTGRSYTNPREACQALVDTLLEWTERLNLGRLSAYGVTGEHIAKIVAHSRGSSMQTNPIALSDPEVAAIVTARL